MRSTEILMNEHRVIEQVLDVLNAIAKKGVEEGKLDQASAESALYFFKTFADKCHHGKEEDHLFLMLESLGMSRENGPTGVMLHEHEQGRGHIRGMEQEIAAAAQGDAGSLRRFSEQARHYIELLCQHIQKEDHCLFPMADRIMTPAHEQALMAAFEHVETGEHAPDVHESCLRIASELAQRYGVPQTATSASCGQTGHVCAHHAKAQPFPTRSVPQSSKQC